MDSRLNWGKTISVFQQKWIYVVWGLNQQSLKLIGIITTDREILTKSSIRLNHWNLDFRYMELCHLWKHPW